MNDETNWNEIAIYNAATVESLAHMIHLCAHDPSFPRQKIAYAVDVLFELCDPLIDSVEKCAKTKSPKTKGKLDSKL